MCVHLYMEYMLALLSCKKSEGKCGFGAQINVCSYSFRVVNLLNLFRRIEHYFLLSPSFSLSPKKKTIEMLVRSPHSVKVSHENFIIVFTNIEK